MQPMIAFLVAGVGYYLYTNRKKTKSSGKESICPEGYVMSSDGIYCLPISGSTCDDGFILSTDGITCEASNPCGDGFILSADGTECLYDGNPCGDGFKLSEDKTECEYDGNPCGDKCLKLNEETMACDVIPNCGTVTGNQWGDVALYMGEYIVLNTIYSAAGTKVAEVMTRRAEQAAERKAAKEIADASAKKLQDAVAKRMEKEAAELAARKLVQEQARNAIKSTAQKEAAEVLGKRTANIVAKEATKEVAVIAGKKLATKVAVMMAKMAATASTGIGLLLAPLQATAIGLSVGLAVSGTRYEKDSPSDFQWDDLPEGARVAIEAFPGVGDVISIMMNFVAFKTGCPTGLVEQNGLCYEPDRPGFKCEAFLCYANANAYPDGGFNGLSETSTHMTKRILMDTGTIPNKCPDGMDHGDESTDAAPGFCYRKPDFGSHGSHIVMGTAWENCEPGMTDTGVRCEDFYGGGVGELKVCPAGWSNDGLTCSEPITYSSCSPGDVDDGLLCRVPLSGGGCHHECTGDPWKPVWEDGHQVCRDWCDPVRGGNVYTKTGYGGRVEGRGAGGKLPCPAGKSEGSDGLCYDACREGYRREGLFCTRSYTKRSQVLNPESNICPGNKKMIGGLCYTGDVDMPRGYRRKVLGTLDQDCPQDRAEWTSYPMFNATQDIGVSCQKATYTRKPFPKFSIYSMKKVVDQETPDEPPPPLCSTLPKTKEGVTPTTLCRLSETPVGFDMTPDGLNFYKKCRDGFQFKLATKECQMIHSDGQTESYPNSEGITAVEYFYV